MNNPIFISVLALLFGVISSTARGSDESTPESRENMGYFFGYSFGNMLKQGGNEQVDLDMLMQGLQDSLANKTPDLTDEQQQAIIAQVQANQQRRQAEAGEAQRAAGESFLAENANREGVKTTESGLQYRIIEAGEGESPSADSTVRVHYEGRLIDGTVFDSSYERDEPAEFALNQVIPGWAEGLQFMQEGGEAELFIPSDLAYGPGGTRGIPPNSVLVFEVELLEVK